MISKHLRNVNYDRNSRVLSLSGVLPPKSTHGLQVVKTVQLLLESESVGGWIEGLEFGQNPGFEDAELKLLQ